MEIHFHASTDIGKVRSSNEDYFINEKISEEEFLFAVADGMGGHQAGDVASKLACERFLETYKACRKKKLGIIEAMEFAIRRANQAILKKGEDDPLKKGMGTTFSAVVICKLKAYLIHIGDSRIYFIRRGQIRRLTTDHTFVEKLVENGRISIDEAREHPQKNVLYMSLGAREGFFPEVVKDIQLEDGDAFILCTDGLSNMIPEEQMMQTVLSSLPEDAALELIRLANAGGGTDNITLQIVRIGSIESLEKTKPVKIHRPRKGWITVIAFIGFCLVLLAFWLIFKEMEGASDSRSAREKGGAAPSQEAGPSAAPEVREIDFDGLRDKDFVLADCRFSASRRFFLVKESRLFILNLLKSEPPQLISDSLSPGQQVVPAVSGGRFLLGQKIPSGSTYELTGRDDNSRCSFTVEGRNGPLHPLFLDDQVFLFRDASTLFAIVNWRGGNPEAKPFRPLPDMRLSATSQIYFNKIPGGHAMIHYRPEAKELKVFAIGKGFSQIFQKKDLSAAIPLAIEYVASSGPELVFYFADHLVRFRGDEEKGVDQPYRFPNYRGGIVRVFVDMETGGKVLVKDDLRLYFLD